MRKAVHTPEKVISGGQTGADIGALVGARRVGIQTGGTCPRMFKTEAGEQKGVLLSFGLIPHPSPHYKDRTESNVRVADATILFATHPRSSGSLLTLRFCNDHNKPVLTVDPRDENAVQIVYEFIQRYKPIILNVAGNRESVSPGIASRVASLIQQTFCRMRAG